MYIVLVYRILAICPMNVNNDDNNNSLICRYSSLVLSRQYNIYYNVPLLDSHNRAVYSTEANWVEKAPGNCLKLLIAPHCSLIWAVRVSFPSEPVLAGLI